MFLWRADTLANALREHLPETAPLLEQIAAAYGTRKFADTFRKLYPKCENICIDYAPWRQEPPLFHGFCALLQH